MSRQGQHGISQDKIQLGRDQKQEYHQKALSVLNHAAYIRGGKSQNQIRHYMNAEKIADDDILHKAADESRPDTDSVSEPQGDEDDDYKNEIRLFDAVKNPR